MSLLAALAVVFVAAALLPPAARLLGRDAGYLGALVLAGLAAWVASHGPGVLDGTPVTTEVAWLPSAELAVSLRLDSLAWLFALIVLGIGALVLAYSARYFGPEDRRVGRYLGLLTFFAGAMLGLVLADDVVLLFVFWELTSVSSFFLIGGLGEGKAGALRAFLVTAIGGLALLAAVTLLAVTAGTGSLSAMFADPGAILGSNVAPAIIVLLLLAAGTKSAQFPFHFWLPGAMVAPTPVSTYLHAATMVKAGIYLLFRFTPLFAGEPVWQLPLVLVGLGTSVFAAVVATKQHDLKGLLAYSTVSQLGLLTGLIGIGTPLALAAAALHTLAHALYKATLFMTVGIVDHETGTRDLRELGGLRRALPLTAVAGGLAAASMAGLPPLLGFVSKEEAFAGFVGLGDPTWLGPLAAVLAVAASVGTFAYSARYYLGTFEGPLRTEAHAAGASFALPAAIAAGAGLVLGVVLPLLDPLVNAVSRDTTGASADLHLALWHGPTVPLAMSAVVIVGGLALVAARDRVQRLQDRVTLPSGAAVFDRLYDAVLALGAVIGRPARWRAPSTYVLPVLAAVVVTGSVLTARLDFDALGPGAPSQPQDWVVVLLLVGTITGVVQARSRLAAIAALGLTGFTVAGWFVLLGGPDLALTQLLVESLTMVLVVVVFRRLPFTFAPAGRRRKLVAAVTAVVLGVLAAAATYLLTGRRGLSEVGERFLAEGQGLTGGSNVVNTILVDFRALDTLGEITVLGVAGAAIVALVRLSMRDALARPARVGGSAGRGRAAADTRSAAARREEPAPGSVGGRATGGDLADGWRGSGVIGSSLLSTANIAIAPMMVLASLWLLVRGHNAVGGGFIGGLTAGAAVVLLYLSRGHGRIWQSRLLRTLPLIGAGLLTAVAYGLGGLTATGSFLDGAIWTLPFGIKLAASIVFDIGVYLVVVGLVVAIVRHLGQGVAEEAPDPARVTRGEPVSAVRTDRGGRA